MLGIKQREKNVNFLDVEKDIESIVSKQDLDNLISDTLSKMYPYLKGKSWGVAWSGGKDSVVLDFICNKISSHPSCLGVTDELEFPEFMTFVDFYQPKDLMINKSGHTLKWLSNNQSWLFPKNNKESSRWFKAVQWNAQNVFFNEYDLDILLTGRRKKDANYVGKNGIYKNKSTDVVRYSPLYEWSHEMIIACVHYYNLPQAPFYYWPNGYIVGSGHWAKRKFKGSYYKNWREIADIDISVVHNASKYIQTAKDFLNGKID